MASQISYWLIDISEYPDNKELGKFDNEEKAKRERVRRGDASTLVVVPARGLFEAIGSVERYSPFGSSYFDMKMARSLDFSDIFSMNINMIYGFASRL